MKGTTEMLKKRFTMVWVILVPTDPPLKALCHWPEHVIPQTVVVIFLTGSSISSTFVSSNADDRIRNMFSVSYSPHRSQVSKHAWFTVRDQLICCNLLSLRFNRHGILILAGFLSISPSPGFRVEAIEIFF